MKLDSLKPLIGHRGPLTWVCIDLTPADEVGDRDLRGRWHGLRRRLEQEGAPAATLEVLAAIVLRPTHVPGPHGRMLVLDGTEVLFDRVLSAAPPHEGAGHGGVPALTVAAQAAEEAVRYLLVEVDRTGADLSWSGTGVAEVPDTVEGGHDVHHRSERAGSLARSRMQARIEDSWERNAEAVAAELDRAVAAHRPELVLVTGDVRAVALLRAEVGRATQPLIVEVPGGSRADGVKEAVWAAHVHEALEEHRARRRAKVTDQFVEGAGRGDGAVSGLADVVAVLRRSQALDLVILQDEAGGVGPLAGRTLWIGPDPLQVAERPSELAALGVVEDDARQVPADAAVVRAAVAQDAGVTFARPGTVAPADGIGAVLRWHDPGTPHEATPAYTGDVRRLQR